MPVCQRDDAVAVGGDYIEFVAPEEGPAMAEGVPAEAAVTFDTRDLAVETTSRNVIEF